MPYKLSATYKENDTQIPEQNSVNAADSYKDLEGIAHAFTVVKRMLDTDGCAWHKEQTHLTLTRYLTEEVAEVVEAVESGYAAAEVAEELGDVLYQVLLHAAISERDGEGYSFNTIGEKLAQKLIARHPHVFADMGPKTAAELTQMWQELKAAAKSSNSRQEDIVREQHDTLQNIFAGIPNKLSTLLKAQKIAERAHGAGQDPRSLIAHIEIDSDEKALAAELFEVVSRAVKQGVDMDLAVRQLLLQAQEYK